MASNTSTEPDHGSSHKANCPTTQPGTGDAGSSPSQPPSTSIPLDDGDQKPQSAPLPDNPPDVPGEQEPLEPAVSTPPVAPEPKNSRPPSPASESATSPPAMPSTTTSSEQPQPTSESQMQDAREETQSESPEPKPLSPAIGPSSDLPSPSPKDFENAGASLVITLLLTTGARHPFKIDGKYLRKREVNVPDNDPFAMSVYTLKELIWREWRSDSKFNRDTPNVVHMTVKPQDIVEEEDAKATKGHYSRDREESDRSPGCRCIIL
ncbi:conserved hypothetical protein [Uncinocarpus reesii 1704]|uniref:UBL3-like ubiquitin domain-containing protein n=1 Tax=Uncinocarpus reesii (strain UAMH 1704) TaxID=336963 RepID=C4JDI0_UNCRE|nr:uncharacterized protein UREG_00706 [Uncinocarpus reesii 1704]EEP75859.1 conserved hypothetical protein [Uncinocarpus reesii 1704]